MLSHFIGLPISAVLYFLMLLLMMLLILLGFSTVLFERYQSKNRILNVYLKMTIDALTYVQHN